ncbi:MAG: 16S rRNA (guanine(527)-N(7))-methyltransferase RsmG [Clostridiaceae bacterium]|nr:16S rRNA (guanine(527)-N(7))-methyltransferase RsmG [Clostridiaceae bacterium]
MTNENIKLLYDGAKMLGMDISDEALAAFAEYYNKLISWNERVNLTAITCERDVVIKHFLDSLTLIRYLPANAKSLVDVGTGAGFPGIPVKLVKRYLSLTLVDSLNKRINFLNELIADFSLTGINVVHSRAEDLGRNPSHRENYDVGTARAVASLPVLCEYILPLVRTGGVFIAMKGSEIQNELFESERAISVLGGKLETVEKFMLPFENMERHIILIKKIRQTPAQYPRKSGKPTKSPIS